MTRGEARFSHIATILVGGTGVVYAWMRYLAEPVDEFALVNHPWEPDVHMAHLVLAPLMVFSLGAVWRTHVWAKLRANRRGRRPTGWLLALVAIPMIASGYLLQVAESEIWRTIWVWTHGVTGFAWIGAYLAHPFVRKRPRADAEAEWTPRKNDHLVEPFFQGEDLSDA